MPRSKSDWEKWFSRREGKPSYAKGTKKVSSTKNGQIIQARFIGEKSNLSPLFDRSYVEKNADYRRANPTHAEAKLQSILNEINGGVLRGRFV